MLQKLLLHAHTLVTSQYIYVIIPPLRLDFSHVLGVVSTITGAVSNLNKTRARVLFLPNQTDKPLDAPAASSRCIQISPEPYVLVIIEHMRDDTRPVSVPRVGVGSVTAYAVARDGVGELEGSECREAGDCRCGLEKGSYGLEIAGSGAGLKEETEDVVACWNGAGHCGFVDFGECETWGCGAGSEEVDHFVLKVIRLGGKDIFIRPADFLGRAIVDMGRNSSLSSLRQRPMLVKHETVIILTMPVDMALSPQQPREPGRWPLQGSEVTVTYKRHHLCEVCASDPISILKEL